MRPRHAIAALPLCLALSSCGLLLAPVRVGGGLVKGTAQLTEKAVKAPGEAHRKRKERKEREKAKEEAAQPADPAAPGGDISPAELPLPDASLPDTEPLPDYGPDLPPLPDDGTFPPS